MKKIEKSLNILGPTLIQNFLHTVIPCTGMHTLKYLEIDAGLNTLFGHF